MQNAILRALLIEWSRRLQATYNTLDAEFDTLIEREYTVSYRFVGDKKNNPNPSPFALNFTFNLNPAVTPETHPEKFEEVKEYLPYRQLAELKDMIATIDALAYQLDQPVSFWHGRLTPTEGETFSFGHDYTARKESSDDQS